MTIWVDFQGDTTHYILKADDTAYLVGSFCGLIEDLACVRIWVEWLTLDDADGREHAEPIRTGEIVTLTVHKPLELIPHVAIADRQHVNRDAGGVGVFHRLGAGLAVERIDFRLCQVLGGRRQVLRVPVEPAQKSENIFRG